jgi:hypothetical protein
MVPVRQNRIRKPETHRRDPNADGVVSSADFLIRLRFVRNPRRSEQKLRIP